MAKNKINKEIQAQKRANRMSYFSSLFVSIDQLANTLAFGNPDNTISARVGKQVYKNVKSKKPSMVWQIYRCVIDRTFYPLDGPNHCKEAYFNDNGEFFYETNTLLAIIIMGIFIFLACIPLFVLFHVLWAFGFIAPKYINRNYNIQRKILLTYAKLQGAQNELNDNDFVVYRSLPPLLNPTINLSQELQSDLLKRIKKSNPV